jgi:LemA protein
MLAGSMLVIAILIAVAAVLYNSLVRDRNRTRSAWGDIDVQLQRRHDLIPRLVSAVDRYAGYEKATLQAVTALREEAAAMSRQTVQSRGVVEEKLSDKVRLLLAVAEQYPELKASDNFLQLQQELVDTEDYLQFARRFYNGAVRQYNTRIETVPANIVATAFGFTPREYFQKAADEVASVPLARFGHLE